MPSYRYRNPLTGRIVSRIVAVTSLESYILETLERGRAVNSEVVLGGVVEGEYGGRTPPNWYEKLNRHGPAWLAYDANNPISHDALDDNLPPWGTDAYRLVMFVPYDPRYPRGYLRTHWILTSDWPPPVGIAASRGATGIAAIEFRPG